MNFWQVFAICVSILFAGAAIERAIRAQSQSPPQSPKPDRSEDRGEHLLGR